MLTQIQLEGVYARLNCYAEDLTEHARRIEELEDRLAFLTGLKKRIEQLERLLEKGHKKED